MSQNKILFVLSLLFLCVIFPAHADILHLHSGDSLEGEIVSESEDHVTFEVEGGRIDFQKSEIKEIERGEASEESKKKLALQLDFLGSRGGAGKPIMDKIKSFFEKFTQEKSSKKSWAPTEDFQWETWMVVLLHSALGFFVCGFTMKGYFLLSKERFSYWKMLWFQLKVFLVGLLVAAITGLIMGVVIGILAQETAQEFRYLIWFAAFAAYAINYYLMAHKDLDAGFVQAFCLALVMGATNFLVALGLNQLGLGYDPAGFLGDIPLPESFLSLMGQA